MGWVTSSRNKYRSDIFFRTEFNVIFLQIVFAVVVSLLVAVAFNYLYKDLLTTILDGITENLKSGGSFSSSDIVNSIQIVRAKNFFNFLAVSLMVSLLFGYVIARITLYPTRNALKSQKRFVSDIAHELRTPLSVIKTNSEVALMDDSFNKNIRNIFKNNIVELDRVSGIINNLLTFSSFSQPEQIKFSLVNMGQVVDSSIGKLDDLIKKKEIKIKVRKTSPYSVWGNMIALEQIVINIVKNAINYNNFGGFVDITLGPDYNGNIVLTVEDNGVGIPESSLAHIFEPFYRADKSRSRQYGSSGLGLTIVSELIKLHSGKISVVSRLKQGTTVTVVLPYTKDNPVTYSSGTKEDNEVSMDFLKRK